MLKFGFGAVAALVVSSCSTTPPAVDLAVLRPSVGVSTAHYTSVTAGTRTFRPVGPKGWENPDGRAAPKPGGDS